MRQVFSARVVDENGIHAPLGERRCARGLVAGAERYVRAIASASQRNTVTLLSERQRNHVDFVIRKPVPQSPPSDFNRVLIQRDAKP